jgi:hypothetical protein
LTLPAATDTLVGRATTDTLTNKTLTGAAMNGTLGATTPSTASVTTLTTSSTVTHNGGTANGVAYLNGSKVLTTGGSLTWDGTNLTVNTGTVSATYGKLTVAGGISITPDSSSKFQIGRYSAGAPYSYIKMDSTSSGFKFTDPTDSFDLMALNSTGALSLYGASVSANGVGITFPATQSASSNANTLDDYEEGTWTPNQGAGLTVVGTFSSLGTYTKVGRIVTVNLSLSSTVSISASANGILCSNLPFPGIEDLIGGYGSGQHATATPTLIVMYAYTSNVRIVNAVGTATGMFMTITYTAA